MTYEDVKRIRANPTMTDVDNEELARMIDEAIELQIPKRVLGKNGEFAKTDWVGYRYTPFICPTCKKRAKHYVEHCDKCGQHLLFPIVSFTPYVEGQKQEVILNWSDEQ